MVRRRFRCALARWGTLALVSLFASGTARAHSVAVAPPDQKDQVLVESFSRLCGELSMYGLDVQQIETAGADAIGGVSLVRSGGQPSARIWITAPAKSDKADKDDENDPDDKIVRITITVADADAPTLLAIRAADVLRASLRDYRGLVLPAPANAVSEAPALPAAVAVEAPAAPPASAARGGASPWTVTASASMLLDPGRLGMGLAPSLEVRRRLAERLFVMVEAIGPVMGHGVASSAGSAQVREALVTAALAVRLAERPRVALDLFTAAGPAYLAVHGDALPPWTAQSSSAWAGVFGAGARFTFRLTSRLALRASSAAMFILPRPVVDLGADSYAMGQPLVLSSLGLDLAL